MSRNRFDSVKQNIHLSDNDQLDKNDRFSKLRPLFDLINKKNIQFGIFFHNLFIDEEMVPYFGRHSCKMYIKGKPIRFGFNYDVYAVPMVTCTNSYLMVEKQVLMKMN
jgi:DNA excision repair protein ERCC-6|uniref:PiggyBac transposable element-derived protein 3 n=1 Tax=Sipha flava TaxID=143950 RepID=A0A2S2R041_9HEMI